MKKWLLLLVYGIEAFAVLLVVYFEPTYCVRGHLWREAFYDGKPTSYWRDELKRWEVSKEYGISWLGHRETVFRRNSTSLEQFRERWHRTDPQTQWETFLAKALARQSGPRLLHGDPQAIPVLEELLEDPSPKIRCFAEIGLGRNPQIPGDEE